MTQLISTYLAEGKIYEALLVGQNLAFRNCNKVNFEGYWNLLIKLTRETDDLILASKYIDQANALIAYFAENVELSQETVDFLIEKRHQLDDINSGLQTKILEKEQELIRVRTEENAKWLHYIDQMAESAFAADTEAVFQERLERIRLMDAKIQKDYLTYDQQQEYGKLTSRCAEIVSARTSYFEREKNIEYNNSAVEAYEKAFNFFKSGKSFDAHLDIIKNLFAFDGSRLFNETVIYYNHVYSYIFSKLSDEEKLAFTKVAINYSKKR